ncbi:FHA domain-containing protein [Lyngbya sp. CCY1209]|uniref:FHA domain-containing protein n=1 Tax=Lyngbya sp. CCY1209 TaxID=2886103 RepID=UPI002D217213|nr:FHA domain-containing protein [Lyngbya sp. CCY1209]MEB3885957.1 FHA domain-containing protein [Lyngbya sp. CCY1209]
MIVCPNCNHQNPEGATQCEACYTPLPTTTDCPNCGATVQTDAAFCGQCGYNLQPSPGDEENQNPAAIPTQVSPPPDLTAPDPIPDPEPLSTAAPVATSNLSPTPAPTISPDLPETPIPDPAAAPPVSPAPQPAAPIAAVSGATNPATQLQKQSASLMHVQSQNQLELPPNLSVIHIGKPNDLVPPDVDVSGFPHAEVVSRTHADIRVEGDAYYIEDVGSSNGTYINNIPLPKGNRHRLRPGDRISLGKGDLVSFIFQLS